MFRTQLGQGSQGAVGPRARSTSTSPKFTPALGTRCPHPDPLLQLPLSLPCPGRAPSRCPHPLPGGGQRRSRACVPKQRRAVFAQGGLAALPPLPHAAFPSRSLPACLLALRRRGTSQAAPRGTPSTSCITWVPVPGLEGQPRSPGSAPALWAQPGWLLATGDGERLALPMPCLYLGRAHPTQGTHRETGVYQTLSGMLVLTGSNGAGRRRAGTC